ncbi:helix-turn-helix domain-containing protein [Streptomyces sp. NBC_01304]|uniref:helix-turn-helix domain-containing protein n=1 Tax=Streptomyces sp. NBC_01304 TaxID=2903818 RepID=UPI002E122D65|nr:helix-turn-helix domain-containing protein [Streptomyces sp. NBC_01304]WSJ90889.1 helix-turn-helix domain-containing protein [Streptomyces sp. NBC_01304]
MTTFSKAASGNVLPKLPVVLAYARACGGNTQYWSEQWLIAQRPGPLDGLSALPIRSTTPPDPGTAATPGEFVELLRDMRTWAGEPSFKQLSRRTGLAVSTLADALSPSRSTVPSNRVVTALVSQFLHLVHRSGRPLAMEPELVLTQWNSTRQALAARRTPSKLSATRERTTAYATTQPQPQLGKQQREERGRPWRPLDGRLAPERRKLAEALRDVCSSSGLSLRELSRSVCMSPSALSRHLSGERIPSPEVISALIRRITSDSPAVERARHVEIYRLHAQAVEKTGSTFEQLRLRLQEEEAQQARLTQQIKLMEEELDSTRIGWQKEVIELREHEEAKAAQIGDLLRHVEVLSGGPPGREWLIVRLRRSA